ncbi:ferredoxin-fold anticodon-binding domain-containing protein 1-like isoform X3 [Haemaphysalis longicornis]
MVSLLVGEGDFSYALWFAAQVGPANVVATCLEPSNPKVDGRIDNMAKLRAAGVRVLMDVDARAMHQHPWVSQQCNELKEIIFNFPHTGGKMKIGENRRLLREFFVSAGRVLRPGSCVRVALCRGQGGTPADAPRPRADTWQVVEMATFGGFVLRSLEPFHAPPGYQPRGYRGGAKGFHTDGALTHIFCLAGSAVPTRLSAACIRQDADCLADRIRSRMDNSEHVLGQTVHALAAALAVGSSQLVASFASGKRDRSSVASPWQARLVGRPEWSPSLPPWSHILDVSTTKEAVVTLAAVQELCHGRLTPLHCTDDGGCRLLCRDFHVATLHTPDSRSFVLEGGLRDILGDFPPSLTTFQGSLTLSVDIEVLAMLAGGLDDWRLLLSSPGVEPSLYPPRYSHDLSFWLDEHFDEALFLRLLRNAAGDVLRSVCLIDEYCSRGEGGGSGRQSRCYRLGYQSPWRALSAEAARDLHLALGAALDELLPSVQVR